MAKINIPKESFPVISDEQTNRFRYRIVNKNRNLYSDWSVIGEIKRDISSIDYQIPNTFSITPSSKSLIAAWEKTINADQQYSIFMKQYNRQFIMSTGTYIYFSDELVKYEDTNKNMSIVYGVFSDKVGISPANSMGAQVVVQNFQYPERTFLKHEILSFKRKSNVLTVYLNPGIKDFDQTVNNSGTFYVDMIANTSPKQASLANMQAYERVLSFSSVTKTPTYTILETADTGTDITEFTPTSGSYIKRIYPDPLFVSSYINYA